MRHPVENSLPVIAAKAPKTQFKTNSTLIFPPKKMYCPAKPIIPPPNEQHMVATVLGRTINDVIFILHMLPKIQQTKMLVLCQRFGDLLLFGLVWQYSSVQTKYNKKGRYKVMATYF